MQISKYIDHTLLKSDATKDEIEQLCYQAKQYDFASVCVNACWVNHAKILLAGTDIAIACVVGFPLGATTTEVKVAESVQAIKNGATEIDMVTNIGFLLSNQLSAYEYDIKKVVEACSGVDIKAILETSKLSKDLIVTATKIADKCGVAFVKTSTGFGGGGATVEDVKLMKDNCVNAQVKASGGIRDYATAKLMIDAGATRLGTSAGIAIVEGENKK